MSWNLDCSITITGVTYYIMIAHFACGWVPMVDIIGIHDKLSKLSQKKISKSNAKNLSNIATIIKDFINVIQILAQMIHYFSDDFDKNKSYFDSQLRREDPEKFRFSLFSKKLFHNFYWKGSFYRKIALQFSIKESLPPFGL